MKVSKEKKEQTRLKLIEAAVEIISEKGFRSTTMKAIANRANVGIATIYNYFPNKDKILYTYFEEQYIKLAKQIDEIEDFNEYALDEQIQTLIETCLDNFLPDREFVAEAARVAIFSPFTSFNNSKRARDIFLDTVKELWNNYIEKRGLETPLVQEWMLLLFWEYYLAIVAYWLEDDSESFNHTTQLIDKSSEIIKIFVESDLTGKLLDLGTFVARTYFHSYLSNFRPVDDYSKGNKEG